MAGNDLETFRRPQERWVVVVERDFRRQSQQEERSTAAVRRLQCHNPQTSHKAFIRTNLTTWRSHWLAAVVKRQHEAQGVCKIVRNSLLRGSLPQKVFGRSDIRRTALLLLKCQSILVNAGSRRVETTLTRRNTHGRCSRGITSVSQPLPKKYWFRLRRLRGFIFIFTQTPRTYLGSRPSTAEGRI